MKRTFVIGDIHGELAALDVILGKLPELDVEDTVVFLGDYVDRGPDSRGVIERVRALPSRTPARIVALRGNHEDKWISCAADADPGFLLPPGNGCVAMYQSFVGLPVGAELDATTIAQFLDVKSWLPADVVAWMDGLQLWYEDEHAIYVHACLEGEGTVWNHPKDSKAESLLWMREKDFYKGYSGKRLVFGHTSTKDLPVDHIGPIKKLFDDPADVWFRDDLIAIDTGAGKGGWLSAVELPRLKVYESR